ncbi:complement factor I-like [Leptodactylus fuscus]|uniref:complement factor I-like n=1 Tax=Leptodactylus fuscus TaxID=238119 RepID=UPI003F4EA678
MEPNKSCQPPIKFNLYTMEAAEARNSQLSDEDQAMFSGFSFSNFVRTIVLSCLVSCYQTGTTSGGSDLADSLQRSPDPRKPYSSKYLRLNVASNLWKFTERSANMVWHIYYSGLMCYCVIAECNEDQFSCVNEKCIDRNRTCNGQNDCGDLSDELCCTECANRFHCKSDTCIPREYMCNGEVDCITGEDEVNCKGMEGYCSHACTVEVDCWLQRTEQRQGYCVRQQSEKREEPSRRRKSERKREGSNAVNYDIDAERRLIKKSISSITCGVPKEPKRVKRIIGGEKAVKNQFPWQVAIKDGSKINCGGIYIGGCWVLTAAHCVRSDQAHRYRIIVELLNILAYNNDIDSFPVKTVKVHERYNPNTYENDIALLEVQNIYKQPTCMQADNNLVPACVPWSPYQFKAGGTCTVSGWGRGDGLSKVFHLKWGHIHLMNNCSSVYKERFFDKMECAGTYDGSIDSCKGDSGGPLVCHDAEGVAYVWGIVSWGENCGEPGYPGVYTKVAHYFEWISQHVTRPLIAKHNI